MCKRFEGKPRPGDIVMVILSLVIVGMGLAILWTLPASWPDRVCFTCIIGIAFIIGVRDR